MLGVVLVGLSCVAPGGSGVGRMQAVAGAAKEEGPTHDRSPEAEAGEPRDQPPRPAEEHRAAMRRALGAMRNAARICLDGPKPEENEPNGECACRIMCGVRFPPPSAGGSSVVRFSNGPVFHIDRDGWMTRCRFGRTQPMIACDPPPSSHDE